MPGHLFWWVSVCGEVPYRVICSDLLMGSVQLKEENGRRSNLWRFILFITLPCALHFNLTAIAMSLACHSEEQGILGLFISNYSLQACLFLGCFPFHLFSPKRWSQKFKEKANAPLPFPRAAHKSHSLHVASFTMYTVFLIHSFFTNGCLIQYTAIG